MLRDLDGLAALAADSGTHPAPVGIGLEPRHGTDGMILSGIPGSPRGDGRVRTDREQWREPQVLVETGALEAALGEPDLRIVDCTTWLRPAEPGDDAPYRVEPGRSDYDAGHIPGAVFLDIQGEISDPDTRHRFMCPAAERFADAMGRLGIGDGVRVVLYSAGSIMWATRVWWMLRAFGFDAAAVLDGGFEKWKLEGRPVTTAPGAYPPARFEPRPRSGFFADRHHVLDRLGRRRQRHGERARPRVPSRRGAEPVRPAGPHPGQRQCTGRQPARTRTMAPSCRSTRRGGPSRTRA